MRVEVADRRRQAVAGVGARVLLLAAGTVLGGGTALGYALPHLFRLDWSARIDDLVAGALIFLGAVVAGWYVLTALVGLLCLSARRAGVVWRRGEAVISRAGAPLLRRALGAWAGAALVTGSLLVPAYSSPDAESEVPVDLTWAGEHASEERETGGAEETQPPESEAAATDHPEPALTGDEPPDAGADDLPQHDPNQQDGPNDREQSGLDADGQSQSYTVRAGDSLWRIAAAHLPSGSTDAQIAEHWPRWYQANAQSIGSDPGLIHPGQVLDHPERST